MPVATRCFATRFGTQVQAGASKDFGTTFQRPASKYMWECLLSANDARFRIKFLMSYMGLAEKLRMTSWDNPSQLRSFADISNSEFCKLQFAPVVGIVPKSPLNLRAAKIFPPQTNTSHSRIYAPLHCTTVCNLIPPSITNESPVVRWYCTMQYLTPKRRGDSKLLFVIPPTNTNTVAE